MPRRNAWVMLVACALWACGSTEAEPSSEPSAPEEPGAEAPATEESTAEDEATADEAAPAEEAPEAAAGDGPTITVTRLSGTESAPATGMPGTPATATVSVEGDAVVLALESFVTFCGPAPTFAARIEGGTLVVEAVRPENPTRCIGPHSARLRLDGVPPGEHAVSVRNSASEEVATAQVTVGG